MTGNCAHSGYLAAVPMVDVKISIVVPAFNEEKLIVRSLQSIRHAATAFLQIGWEYEIIVCDNNSSDRTGELARAERARVLFEPVNQISRARNAGAGAANGEWLVFVDADSFPSTELFADMADHIRTGRYIGGGATVELDQPVGWAIGFICAWNCLSRWQRWMAGSFIFCESGAFRKLGGFSRELFVAEEIDFSQRLNELAKSQGQRVIVLHRQPLNPPFKLSVSANIIASGNITVQNFNGLLSLTNNTGNIAVSGGLQSEGSCLQTNVGNVTFAGNLVTGQAADTGLIPCTTNTTQNTHPWFSFKSGTGSVTVTLSAVTSNFTLDASTNNGKINANEFNLNVQQNSDGSASYYGPLTPGASPTAVLALTVSTGDITLHKAG